MGTMGRVLLKPLNEGACIYNGQSMSLGSTGIGMGRTSRNTSAACECMRECHWQTKETGVMAHSECGRRDSSIVIMRKRISPCVAYARAENTFVLTKL